ncbi:hypothetical protein ACFX13_018238 [Malus domestica]
MSRYAPFKVLFVLKRLLSCSTFAYIISNSSCHKDFTIVLAVESCFAPDDLVLLLMTWQSPCGSQLCCATTTVSSLVTFEHQLGRPSDDYAMHLNRRFIVLLKFQNQI